MSWVSRSQPSTEYDEDLSKRMKGVRYFLNFRQDGPDCDHADLIDEAIDEIESLKARIAELESELAGCRACREKVDCLSRGEANLSAKT